MKIILASKSPRRIEIFNSLGIFPEIIPADIDETVSPDTPPRDTVMLLARDKAEHVAKQHPDALVVAADTMVFKDGLLLGKPKNTEDAYAMLSSLSGYTHSVFTGIAVCYKGKTVLDVVETKVLFRDLSKSEIESYIDSNEPFDKAGAYGIQGLGALLVKEIHGDYFNVVGLPVSRLFEIIRQNFGFEAEQIRNTKPSIT